MSPASSIRRYGPIVWHNACSQLRHRYAGSGLGVSWNIVNPLAQIVVYTVVFSNLMPSAGGAHFALYLCAGILPWLAFVETTMRGAQALVANAGYLKKLPTPEPVYVLQEVVAATLGLCISMSLLMLISILLGSVQATWALLPAALALLMLFGAGLALLLGTINVFFRDVTQLLGVLLFAWMWFTPIVYRLEDIHTPWLRAAIELNPMTWYVRAAHLLFLDGVLPSLGCWAAMAAGALVTLTAGVVVFRRLAPQVRDAL